ncbi:MAG: tetratricopeptide repeat protein [Planctomycetota bacterium]
MPCAAAQAEVVVPDAPAPEPKTPPRTNPEEQAAKTGEHSPLTVDEPDFKARVIVPMKADKVLRPADPNAALPQEEAPADEAQPSEKGTPAAEANIKEDISPALAKAIAKERETKQPKELAPLYQAVVDAEPENAAAHYRLGLALLRSGELAKGLAALQKAVALQPGNPKYLCDLGLAALRSGLRDQALAACRAAVTVAPSSARYQSALGDCFLAAGRLVEAAEAYKCAIRAAPNNAEYMHNLAVVHIQAGNSKKAVEVLGEAIRLSPKHSQYYCSRGLAESNLNEVRAAIRDLSAALTLDPKNAYAHFLLASLYSDPEDPTYTSSFEAVEHAQQAVKLTEFRNAPYLMGLARALHVSRRYDQAVEAAKKAIALDPRPEFRKELAKFEQDQMPGDKFETRNPKFEGN